MEIMLIWPKLTAFKIVFQKHMVVSECRYHVTHLRFQQDSLEKEIQISRDRSCFKNMRLGVKAAARTSKSLTVIQMI